MTANLLDSPWHARGDWMSGDIDLVEASSAPFAYRPNVLRALGACEIRLLHGPRRVGKTTATKFAAAELLGGGMNPAQIRRASLEGAGVDDLEALFADTGGVDTPVIWMLDEATEVAGWEAALGRHRRRHHRRGDAYVVTGSSPFDLTRAGADFDPTIETLMPLCFADFCAAAGYEFPVGGIHPRDLLGDAAIEFAEALRGNIDELAVLWDTFLRVGGYPRVVAGWLAAGKPLASQSGAHDVVLDVLRESARWLQSPVLSEIGRLLDDSVAASAAHAWLHRVSDNNVASLRSLRTLATGLGTGLTTSDGNRVLSAATSAHIVWTLPTSDADDHDHAKVYVCDPFVAHLDVLASLPSGDPVPALDNQTVEGLHEAVTLTECRRALERADPGSWLRPGALRCLRPNGPQGREVDLAGPGTVPLDGKYQWGAGEDDMSGQRGALLATANRPGVLATRHTLHPSPTHGACIPAPIIALALTATVTVKAR